MKLSSVQVGVAGEYLVAAELSRRNYVASLTLRNTRGIDLLASSEDGSVTASIQVKTNQNDRRQWPLSKKNEDDAVKNVYYVFVRLNGLNTPHFHIVPGDRVAEAISIAHQEWLATPAKNGQPHKDNSMRNFKDPNDRYLDRWDLLGLG